MKEIGQCNMKNLIAGDYPLKAIPLVVELEQDIKMGDVITIENNVCKVISTENNITGIVTDDFEKVEDEVQTITVYLKGEFNKNYLNFGAADEAKAIENMIKIGLLVR